MSLIIEIGRTLIGLTVLIGFTVAVFGLFVKWVEAFER